MQHQKASDIAAGYQGFIFRTKGLRNATRETGVNVGQICESFIFRTKGLRNATTATL